MGCVVLSERMVYGATRAYWSVYPASPLGSGMLLRACYAMSDTEIAYGATRVLCDVRHGVRGSPGAVLPSHQVSHTPFKPPLPAYSPRGLKSRYIPGRYMRCIRLRACYAMPGTERAYGATRSLLPSLSFLDLGYNRVGGEV
eukprot:1330754-Rhodomonas_salina.6